MRKQFSVQFEDTDTEVEFYGAGFANTDNGAWHLLNPSLF